MLRDWPWAGRVMRTVPGGQALLGLFFENAHGSHGTTCSSVMVVVAWSYCSGQHFQFFGGDRDTVPFFVSRRCLLILHNTTSFRCSNLVRSGRGEFQGFTDNVWVENLPQSRCSSKVVFSSSFSTSTGSSSSSFKKIRNCLLSSGHFAWYYSQLDR